MATAAGVTQAVFPEGGLSRDGRLRPPKLGILDYMLRAFDPAASATSSSSRSGINYDRTFEDRSLLAELDPSAARPGTTGALANTLRFVGRNLWLMARNRWHRFGYACVNFGSPVSLAGWSRSRGVDFRALSKEERFGAARGARARADGRDRARRPGGAGRARRDRVRARARASAGASSSSRRACSSEIEGLERRGAHVYVPRGDQDYAITVGLRMLTLRRLVEEDASRASTAPVPEELPLLRYYARSIEHLFA